jgi:vitamin B12/bleomycin/antimicrobial peptide transport system ATP-binding/permease protein
MGTLTTALRDIGRLLRPWFGARESSSLNMGPLGTWRMPERWIAWGFVGIIIAVSLAQVGMNVRLSYVSRDIYNALQEKSAAKFWSVITDEWVPWVAVYIASFVLSFVVSSTFKMRWRAWATDRAMGLWLNKKAHYRLGFIKDGVDNPDQRISDDIHKFVETSTSLAVGLLKQVTTLVSFSVILWTISAEFTLPGTETKVPGLLLWVALVYAVFGTVVAHLIGRRLVLLNFIQEKVEANFRFSLARLREFSESIALLDGEKTEIGRLQAKFKALIANFFAIVRVQKWLAGFQNGYASTSSLVPFIVGAPYYFAGRIELGTLMQTADAFGSVQGALSYFIDSYATLADYKAVVDRLTSFENAIDGVTSMEGSGDRIERYKAGEDMSFANFVLEFPDGKAMVEADGLKIIHGQSTLITGPSGSGKSTLFRAIAGIWPFGHGSIDLPEGHVMVLPQRSYMPNGTLREALAYPGRADSYDDATLGKALEAVELGHLVPMLDLESSWTQRLSGGEQQRLAFARALLAKPDFLLLDESTSALDEGMEARIYAMLKAELPQTTLVSIGHRGTLKAMHQRQIEMRPTDGVYSPVPLIAA